MPVINKKGEGQGQDKNRGRDWLANLPARSKQKFEGKEGCWEVQMSGQNYHVPGTDGGTENGKIPCPSYPVE